MVSTPIGNLGDMTHRGAEVLASVAAILAEDTRHSRSLLDAYEVRTPMLAYHEHNEARMTPQIVERLRGGESFALVSDAGTPLLSDPGARLVAAAIDAGIAVSPVPGASALLAALVASGLDATRFTFYGFLARKGRERGEAIEAIAASRHTAVLYEAPGRVGATLADLADAGAAERPAAVARELTKTFEEIRRGTVGALGAYYAEQAPRGEVVIVVGGAGDAPAPDEATLRARAAALRSAGATPRDVGRALVAEFGIGRNEAYRIAQATDDPT
ncbi:16S rRNA (cytidine(1402)-2'-O)-methyltransferase [Gemmatirosa kalamazoonensis]|uniref:16S rRNA (cytidine(1402)-2'-O)-methyltransferase n=1 Tax=Gemmatirosa kalamazoonensis TaxID=861299 RepID=UPI0004B0C5DB|nr:16S rRNA (cytidine(1402)-2'-O)-methyltransferase [Gemmatirosa kalamazoonensis]